MSTLLIIYRRIDQHNNYPREDGPVIPMNVELGRQRPINAIENRSCSVEHCGALVEGRIVFIGL